MNFTKADLQQDVQFKTSRSGGKGGQNVNKVSSKVELLFSIAETALFTDEVKQLLSAKLQSRLNKDGLLQIICDEERSQYLNKEIALERLMNILIKALYQAPKRKKTKPSKRSVEARLEQKKNISVKKQNRRPADPD